MSPERMVSKPPKIFFWYAAWIVGIYLALFETVGTEMALKHLGSGKTYADVLLSLQDFPHKPPNDQARIFFFGDSTIATPNKEEAPPAKLQEQLQEIYGRDTIEVIQWAFTGASMFHYYCLACKAEKYSPSMIIVPINYRTFGEMWDAQTHYGAEGKVMYSELLSFAPMWERFGKDVTSLGDLEPFSMFDKAAIRSKFWEVYYFRGIKLWSKDFLERTFSKPSPVLDQILAQNKSLTEDINKNVGEMFKKKKSSEDLFKGLFPPQVSESQSQFHTYIALIDALRRRRIPFLFYLTPLNIEEMEEYDAYDPVKFQRSIELFRREVASGGGVFVDVSMLLKPGEFTILEHYGPEGAEKLAEALRPEIEIMLRMEERRASR